MEEISLHLPKWVHENIDRRRLKSNNKDFTEEYEVERDYEILKVSRHNSSSVLLERRSDGKKFWALRSYVPDAVYYKFEEE